MTKVTFEKDGTGYELIVEELPAASVTYLLQYGFAQSMQDCIAGRAKAVRAEREKAGDDEADILAAIEADIAGKLGKRMDSIKEGTMGVPAQRDPVATLAREQVKAALKKKGVKADDEKVAALVADHLSKNRAALEAEIARRKAAVVDVEIDI